jgi:AraC-like DNA-binding protein
MGAFADGVAQAPLAVEGARPEPAVLWSVPALPEAEVLEGWHQDTRFAPHWHDCWSLGLIDGGVCRFSCAGSRWIASAGDLVLIPPYVVHTAGVDPGGLSMRMVYLPASLAAEILDLEPALCPPVARHVISDQSSYTKLAGLLAAGLAADSAALRTSFAQALTRFFGPGPAVRLTSPEMNDPRVARLCLRLRETFDERPDFEELAGDLGISRHHLAREFRRVVGLTPGEYLRLWRLERAKQLVAEGVPLVDAAGIVGFADQAHFTRWFKRVFGVTPSRYLARRKI